HDGYRISPVTVGSAEDQGSDEGGEHQPGGRDRHLRDPRLLLHEGTVRDPDAGILGRIRGRGADRTDSSASAAAAAAAAAGYAPAAQAAGAPAGRGAERAAAAGDAADRADEEGGSGRVHGSARPRPP